MMARRRVRRRTKPMYGHHGKGVLTLGFLLFLFGALRFYGFDTNIALMVVGAVLVLKGLFWLKR